MCLSVLEYIYSEIQIGLALQLFWYITYYILLQVLDQQDLYGAVGHFRWKDIADHCCPPLQVENILSDLLTDVRRSLNSCVSLNLSIIWNMSLISASQEAKQHKDSLCPIVSNILYFIFFNFNYYLPLIDPNMTLMFPRAKLELSRPLQKLL